MKKLILLLVLLCGTGSFIMAPDFFTEAMTTNADISDGGDLNETQSDRGDNQDSQEEQILNENGNPISPSDRQPIKRAISWGDENSSVESPNAGGDRGVGTTVGIDPDAPTARRMTADDELSASRGLSLKNTRLQKIDDENSDFFKSLSQEDKTLMRDNKNLIAEHMMDKVIDKRLFGERPLREGETRESIINKYKGRQITAEAQARSAASGDTGIKKTGDQLWGRAKTKMGAVTEFGDAGNRYRNRSLTVAREFDSRHSTLEVNDSANQEQFNMLNESREKTEEKEKRQLVTRNAMLDDPNNEFFSRLSPEDKKFLQERINDNNQTPAIRQIFGEEALDGLSRRDVLDEYKSYFATEEERVGLKRSKGLEGDIKELQAKIERGEGSDADKGYLAVLKDALKEREEALANIMDETAASRQRFSGDLNLTQRSSTELANYRSEALKDQIEKARLRLSKIDRVEQEDIAKALEQLPDNATNQEREAAIERAKEGLSAYRKSLEGELNALLEKDVKVGQYLIMTDKDRSFKFLDAVAEKIEQGEVSFEERRANDEQDPAAFFASSGFIGERLAKYKELLTSISMNELADEDPQFNSKRQSLLDRVENQIDALKDRENELLTVRADKILEEVNSSDDQTRRSFDDIKLDLDMFQKRIAKQKQALEQDGLFYSNKMKNIDLAEQKIQEAYDSLDKKITEAFGKKVDSLNGEVEHYLALKKGARTKEEYNTLNKSAETVFKELGARIDTLAVQEKALGAKEKIKRSWWFGRKRTVIDGSDAPEENKAKLKEIQNQKKQLQALQERAKEMYTQVQDTDPNNARAFRSFRKRFQWGSLSSDSAPKRYSLDDWNRLSDLGRNKLSKENLNQYSNGIDQSQDLQEQIKKGWSFFSKKGQTKQEAAARINQLNEKFQTSPSGQINSSEEVESI